MKCRHCQHIVFLIVLLSIVGCASPDGTRLAPMALSTSIVTTALPLALTEARIPSTPSPLLTVLPSPTVVSLDPTATLADDLSPATHNPPPSWLLAYDSDVDGNDDIYLLPADGGLPVNLTQHPAEDRFPVWSPDGNRIAFQSNRDGNWEIYTLDLRDGALVRLTFASAYDGAPTWSPDGDWIAFESYRDDAPCQVGTPVPNPPTCPDLEIYRVPAQGGVPHRLTFSPLGDYQPVWSPDGVWIAFTSWRDGHKQVYVLPSNGGPVRNVTASAVDDWSPTWSSDGTTLFFLSERDGLADFYRQPLDGGAVTRLTADGLPKERPAGLPNGDLLYARYDPGPAFEAYDPYRPGAYHVYHLAVDDLSSRLLFSLQLHHPAPAPQADLAPLAANSKLQARILPQTSLPELELRRMDDVEAPDPRLTAGVDDAFRAWRAAVHARSGHDFLGRLSDVFRPAYFFGHHLGYLTWHKAGRAVDLLFDWRDADGKNLLYVVREDVAGEIYWRLFLKCAVQDGSLGEPLTQAPWYFWWHPDPAKEPETYANGGRRLSIPAGYFVDVTALAERYGWSRIAAYRLEEFHWMRDSTATEYWHYQHTDALTWYEAMAQIYPQESLDELFSRAVAAQRGQAEAVMDGKDLPPVDVP